MSKIKVEIDPNSIAFAREPEPEAPLPDRDKIAGYHLADEPRLVSGLLERAIYTKNERKKIDTLSLRLAKAARTNRRNYGGIDAFMHEYGLTSEEGVILMCLAESLLRIPDKDTADKLIAEKISDGQWGRHLGNSDSLFVNASTWGLMLTGSVIRLGDMEGRDPGSYLMRAISRSGEPVIRKALRHAVRILGDQFVLGRSIEDALLKADAYERRGYRMSYDMLGEAARTKGDAETYFDSYMHAIETVGAAAGAPGDINGDALMARPGISIKLSALHPRFEPGHEVQLRAQLLPKLTTLLSAARAHGLTVTIDAEEQDRLDLTLALFLDAYCDASTHNWWGFGLAVQAYSRRSLPVLRWLRRISHRFGKRIPVRLVKGAYWDSEIKWAQERGLADYPVFTRKLNTDVSYLACLRYLIADPQAFYPQFATHNAHTLASGLVAAANRPFEFQRLHGMGEGLYEGLLSDASLSKPARIYAPVGRHKDLLAYMVRRLLENGANTSFVNRLADDELPVEEMVRDPLARAVEEGGLINSQLRAPLDIHMPERRNSLGLALSEPAVRDTLMGEIDEALREPYAVGPIIDGEAKVATTDATLVACPHDRRQRVGTARNASAEDIEKAIATASVAAHDWDLLGGAERGKILNAAADLIEADRARLMAVLIREAGKTLSNAQGDIRESVDFLRYYAVQAAHHFADPVDLGGPTGERNTHQLRGRGPIACISPWNFPLAIFIGQVSAALAAGNPVLAKPAEQTSVIAFLATRILHQAGVPTSVLHLLPGDGAQVGGRLISDHRVKGVAFTGSNETAWLIQRGLADRRDAIVPFIAETGGLNAMIVDSTALPEQVVRDAVRSAYDSAGQRCSALRVLYVQDEIAEPTIEMLVGAVQCLNIGDPMDPATDIGPVIDEQAEDELIAHKLKMRRAGQELVDIGVPEACTHGTYVAPSAYEISDISLLQHEVFGPILHVVRFQNGHLDKVCAAINATGYGLTLGVHSRLSSVADYVAEHVHVGNLYVNRDQIGAAVGNQPFGGEGLSGTGPKAGGPNYLPRFATERVRATDITATGGNTQLLAMGPMPKPIDVSDLADK